MNCFRTLSDLIMGYQHPQKRLVAPLLYPVMRESDPNDESSGKMIEAQTDKQHSLNKDVKRFSSVSALLQTIAFNQHSLCCEEGAVLVGRL